MNPDLISSSKAQAAYSEWGENCPITVVLLACDRPEWTRHAIESVLAQSFQEFVLLVSDDSKDIQTELVVIAADDPRIRFVKGPRRGQLANVNLALQLVQTPYVAILHDDDWWDSRLLQELLPAMMDPHGVDVAFCDLRMFDRDERPIPTTTSKNRAKRTKAGLKPGVNRLNDSEQRFIMLLVMQILSPFQGTILKSAQLSVPFPDEVGSLADYWISILVNRCSTKFFYSESTWCAYRIHGSSVAAERKDFQHEEWCMERAMSDAPSDTSKRELRRRFDRVLYEECKTEIVRGEYSEARRRARTVGDGIAQSRRRILRLLCNPVGRVVLRRRDRTTNIRFQ